MKKLTIAASAAALLAASSLAAVAGQTSATIGIEHQTSGTITSVDPSAMTITLGNGKTFKLPPSMDVADVEALNVGKKVEIRFTGTRDVQAILDATSVRQVAG